MTFYYQTRTWNSQPQVSDQTRKLWEHIANKENWRIVQLPNGFYQTEYQDANCNCDSKKCDCDTWHDVTRRETIEGAEQAIDASVEHYSKKLEYISGPKVVKTFK